MKLERLFYTVRVGNHIEAGKHFRLTWFQARKLAHRIGGKVQRCRGL